jgi:hypothetical protein
MLKTTTSFVQVDSYKQYGVCGVRTVQVSFGTRYFAFHPQVKLLMRCIQNNIMFSSMPVGTSTKSDLTRNQIADLSTTSYDPLACVVR